MTDFVVYFIFLLRREAKTLHLQKILYWTTTITISHIRRNNFIKKLNFKQIEIREMVVVFQNLPYSGQARSLYTKILDNSCFAMIIAFLTWYCLTEWPNNVFCMKICFFRREIKSLRCFWVLWKLCGNKTLSRCNLVTIAISRTSEVWAFSSFSNKLHMTVSICLFTVAMTAIAHLKIKSSNASISFANFVLCVQS